MAVGKGRENLDNFFRYWVLKDLWDLGHRKGREEREDESD
jgi:hypothetical protein